MTPIGHTLVANHSTPLRKINDLEMQLKISEMLNRIAHEKELDLKRDAVRTAAYIVSTCLVPTTTLLYTIAVIG